MNWNPILDELLRSHSSIHIADIGARFGIDAKWAPLNAVATIYAFDADAQECERLNKDAPANICYYPFALGDKAQEANLYITIEPACSSLYRPIAALSETVPGLNCIALVREQTVTLVTLDDWRHSAEVDSLTYLKLDTQGSELDILKGAIDSLVDVELVEIEVEFNPIYVGQPLFGDVDHFMRAQGFALWHLGNKVHYVDSDLQGVTMSIPEVAYFNSVPNSCRRGGGQLFWAHAFYVRKALSLESRESLALDRAAKVIAVAIACNLPDLALAALNRVVVTDALQARIQEIREAILAHCRE
jgi:FkbM family methyltransferase